MEPGSSHQSGDRAAHMRFSTPKPPAQDPLHDPTPGPNQTPDPRTVSKSATKAAAAPMRRRQNRGITRFHLSHPDRAAAFVADLDNHRPHLGHPQPGRTRSRLPRARPGRFGTRPRTRPTRPVPAGEWLTPNGATPDAPDAATAPITGRNEVAGGPAGRASGPSEDHR